MLKLMIKTFLGIKNESDFSNFFDDITNYNSFYMYYFLLTIHSFLKGNFPILTFKYLKNIIKK